MNFTKNIKAASHLNSSEFYPKDAVSWVDHLMWDVPLLGACEGQKYQTKVGFCNIFAQHFTGACSSMPFLFLSMSLFSLCLFPFLFPNISLFGWKSSTIKEAGLVVMQLGQTSKNKLNWITCKRIKRIAILAKDLGSKKSQFLQKILDQKESTEKFLASRSKE